ncbi:MULTISPECIES: AraC family transcriptional regulator [unclassified Chelatococcus]|uniref:helix-turn-helix transcriptional regulator n=1 Tax=unclassified Chelatococcus TaxID=2638111 RepID=UPI001BCBAA34|nr:MULTISPECIES: AraC family transcriptional regulator [unclassified Chelatococcus]CAH1668705.1 AraC family transcriptional regulator [Hyphomicrobiales bacterium]MBS7739424.1 helix-turn-helix transcriptional regulator [Chelatococcus sp. HY11]MBX3543793.1 helix-turn-helix transcriptional regulator [Chelatococcus sp.]MCO5076041.1 helix-turn-helix transcriptional regulator [Chelatococcus sp.]CAH1679831.1 AraC family transcriptional regulator [Hyphomicrobiales bacterium]
MSQPVVPAPELYRFDRLSTDDFEPATLYEAWRAAAYHSVDLLPPDEELRGTVKFVRGKSGVFGSHQGSGYQTVFSREARSAGLGECMVIALLADRRVALEGPGDARMIAESGSMALYDVARPMHYHWSKGKDLYLLLPRQAALEAIGGALDGLSLPLERQRLAPFLRTQMMSLEEHGHFLARNELASMLDATVETALLMLRGITQHAEAGAELLTKGLYASAIQFMAAHYPDRDLDPVMIAHALGCSRATLYRAFAEHNTTVMDALRELRMQKARRKLEAATGGNVGTIALACGFPDLSAFGKLFKARFGVSPRDWRMEIERPRALVSTNGNVGV